MLMSQVDDRSAVGRYVLLLLVCHDKVKACIHASDIIWHILRDELNGCARDNQILFGFSQYEGITLF